MYKILSIIILISVQTCYMLSFRQALKQSVVCANQVGTCIQRTLSLESFSSPRAVGAHKKPEELVIELKETYRQAINAVYVKCGVSMILMGVAVALGYHTVGYAFCASNSIGQNTVSNMMRSAGNGAALQPVIVQSSRGTAEHLKDLCKMLGFILSANGFLKSIKTLLLQIAMYGTLKKDTADILAQQQKAWEEQERQGKIQLLMQQMLQSSDKAALERHNELLKELNKHEQLLQSLQTEVQNLAQQTATTDSVQKIAITLETLQRQASISQFRNEMLLKVIMFQLRQPSHNSSQFSALLRSR